MAEFLNNFDKNLLEASLNKEDLPEAKKEWRLINKKKYLEKQRCICNHMIQNVIFLLNIQNGNIICCGTVCCNKFNLEQRPIDNETLGKILKLKPLYNEYRQFLTIQEYLDYAKDELNAFMAKEIELSLNVDQLILLLDNISNIKKTYELDIFNVHIETIKQKLINDIPQYIEFELTRDIESIFKIMKKLIRLYHDYQIPKVHINVFKNCVEKIVENNIEYYSGDTTPKFQKKIESKINQSLILKDFFIEMNEKLKNKIQSIRDYNFAIDKARYEAEQKRKQKMAEKDSKKKYF